MNKPISVKYEEFKQGLLSLINNSGLPAFMIEPILQNYLAETQMLAKRQYELDKSEYEKSLENKDDK